MYKVASDKRQTSLHHGAGLKECFIEIAREQLMPAQFKALMSAAERLKKQYAAEASAFPRPDGAKP